MARGRASNGSGMQPRKRKDGLWEVRASVGTDPGTGKPIRKSFYGHTAAEAAEKLRAATAAVDDGSFCDPSKMRFREWAETWLKEYTGSLRESTKGNYDDCIIVRTIPVIGAVRLCDLTPHMYQRFINSLSTGKSSYAPNTVHNTHSAVYQCLAAAVKCKYIRSNPAENAILPRRKDDQIRFFETEEAAQLLVAARGDALYPMLFFALYTGARESECLGLRWSCIDFSTNELTIDLQLLRTRKLGPTKNGKKRTFTLAQSVINVLKAVKIDQAKKRLAAGPVWEDGDFVFTNAVGCTYSPSFVSSHFRKIMAKAGLSGRVFHSLRHTCAVEALRAGIDPRTVSEQLGHSSVGFTLDRYAHASKGLRDDAALKLEERIKMHEQLSN